MATHALIPRPWRDALNAVAARAETFPTRLLTEAVAELLARANVGFTPDTPPMPKGTLVALVTRIPAWQLGALHALAARTRIGYSEWLRQAADVLLEHNAMPETEGIAPPLRRRPPPSPGGAAAGSASLPGSPPPCLDCLEAA